MRIPEEDLITELTRCLTSLMELDDLTEAQWRAVDVARETLQILVHTLKVPAA